MVPDGSRMVPGWFQDGPLECTAVAQAEKLESPTTSGQIISPWGNLDLSCILCTWDTT
jgi:hypothetical protein